MKNMIVIPFFLGALLHSLHPADNAGGEASVAARIAAFNNSDQRDGSLGGNYVLVARPDQDDAIQQKAEEAKLALHKRGFKESDRNGVSSQSPLQQLAVFLTSVTGIFFGGASS
jgi:hypothetical protein